MTCSVAGHAELTALNSRIALDSGALKSGHPRYPTTTAIRSRISSKRIFSCKLCVVCDTPIVRIAGRVSSLRIYTSLMNNRRAVGLLNPMRETIEGKNRGRGGTTPVITACPEAGKWKCEKKEK